MDSNPDNKITSEQSLETQDRRDLVRKLGRFAAYAAPFTVFAFSKKADAATGGGPLHPHP